MMMHREHAPAPSTQRPLGRCVRASALASAALVSAALVSASLLALSLAAPLAHAAGVEGHPVHVRARTVARQTELAPTDHSKSAGKSGAARSGTKDSKRAVVSKGSAKAGRGAAKPDPGKSGTHAKPGRHKHPVEDDPEPVTIHRAGLRGTRVQPRSHGVAMLAAPVRQPKVAHPTHEIIPATTVADTSKPLTVDDFLRAASPTETTASPNGKVYVRGESRTEEDDRVDNRLAGQVPLAAIKLPPKPILALKPAAQRRPAMPSVQARTPLDPVTPSDSEALEASSPADLVGAPIASANINPDSLPPNPAVHSAGLPSHLPAPTRQELIEEVEQPIVLPGLYRNGRLLVPAPLKGTHEILVHQNLMADDEGLERIQDDYDLNRLRSAHQLVNLPENASLHMNPELAANRRCARVWTVKFAGDMARDFYARFHQPLQVNSAVRTVAYQVRLQRTNGNAAGIGGETASPHLTGQALDFGKRDMSMAQIAWMRSYLLPLMQAGKLDVEEEFQQACFHISVYRSYLPAQKRRVARTEFAQLKEPRVKTGTRGDELR